MDALTHVGVAAPRSVVARARHLLRRRWMFLLLFPLIGLVAAYGLSASREDRYESSAKLLLREQPTDVAAAADPGAADPATRRATNVDLVSSDEVALRVYATLRPAISLDDFLDGVRVSSEGESELVTVSVRNADPAVAARIANAWAVEYRAFRGETDAARLAATTALVDGRLAALTPARRAGSEGQALRRQRDELAVAASLQRAGVEIAQRAREGTSPVSPRPLRAGLLGGLGGLAVGLLLALLVERIDRRIDDPELAVATFRLPLLGQIPRSRALAAAGSAASPAALGAAELDAFRVLRTSIAYPDVERRVGSLLVTSAVAGEGKTTVALNLARAYAESVRRTLLIEGDLRHPVLARRLSLPGGPGLADVLRSDATLASATHRLAPGAGAAHGRSAHLDVVVAGEAEANPQALLEGPRMARMLAELTERYDIVIVDGAPGLGVSDAAPLMLAVDAVLVVSRLGHSQADESRALRERLDLLRVRPLGVVVNGVSRRAGYHPSPRELVTAAR